MDILETASPQPQPQPLTLTLPAAILLAAAVVLVAPWKPTDPDALSHLAIGRTIAEMGCVPATDPLTFSYPAAAWSNPEWLGDLIFHVIYAKAGETGLMAYKLLVITLGWLLAFRLALRQGSTANLAAALLMLILLGSTARFTLRNQIHAYWLVPLYGLILQRSRDRPRLLLLLVLLGALWANLHASFILGWLLIATRLSGAIARPDRRRREIVTLLGLLAFHPLLGMLSPQGISNYGQVLDHLIGADVYRALIQEWRPPSNAPGILRMLPLDVIGLVGLGSFLPRINRHRGEAFLLLAAGLALAHGSQRFLPLLAVLVVPGVAANLSRWMESTTTRFRSLVGFAALLLAGGLLVPVIWVVRTEGLPHVLKRADAPLAAARFLTRRGAASARIFNPYNAGPWLLWAVTRCADGCPRGMARQRIYIDPRNNLGHAALSHYHHLMRADPAAFDREARRRQIDTALLDLTDGHARTLGAHLDASPHWQRVYRDSRFVIYVKHPAADGAPLHALWGSDLNRREFQEKLPFEPATKRQSDNSMTPLATSDHIRNTATLTASSRSTPPRSSLLDPASTTPSSRATTSPQTQGPRR